MSGGHLPHWEHKYPGRCAWELRQLDETGAKYEIDQDQLRKGRLILTVRWPSAGGELELSIAFPDSYPHLRPAIRLISTPDQYPQRHCSPLDGTLCLLGRDSAQWKPSMTLAELLADKLEEALSGKGDEDPQGEPDGFWWKSISKPQSYILVDSTTIPEAGVEGVLKVRFVAKKIDIEPVFRGYIEEAVVAGKAERAPPKAVPLELQASKSTIDIPFLATADRIPIDVSKGPSFIVELIKKYGLWDKSPVTKLTLTQSVKIFGISYSSELQFEQIGRAWLFVLAWGSKNALGSGGDIKIAPIKAFRAGETDLGIRVPSYSLFDGAKIAVFGLGALGAPVAIELARNGLSAMTVLDKDSVEPGNSIRWPLGAEMWNKPKVDAVREFVHRQYPTCQVMSVEHSMGGFSGADNTRGDAQAFNEMLDGARLAFDATASFGPTLAIAEECRIRSIPFLSLYATPGLLGGAVGLFLPNGACPICLEHHYQDGRMERPPSDEADSIQPVGCSERTFTGASFDLAELSEHAMRLAVSVLKGDVPDSILNTLTFTATNGLKIPSWRIDQLSIHSSCSSHDD